MLDLQRLETRHGFFGVVFGERGGGLFLNSCLLQMRVRSVFEMSAEQITENVKRIANGTGMKDEIPPRYNRGIPLLLLLALCFPLRKTPEEDWLFSPRIKQNEAQLCVIDRLTHPLIGIRSGSFFRWNRQNSRDWPGFPRTWWHQKWELRGQWNILSFGADRLYIAQITHHNAIYDARRRGDFPLDKTLRRLCSRHCLLMTIRN